ncbi:MAG: flavodoxin family protein [Desulfobacteraceae bacterium]|nr:MAG: flavodoxin family protein [Desulfobacteraceae bacterium]
MKVIGINASPRKKANTQTLIEAALGGAAEKGAETRLVHLRELKINGCKGCEGCKKQLGKCVQTDDLTPLLQEMTTCDAIVLGTPVYCYHVSAQFKMLVDRLYSFFESGENPETGEPTFKSAFPGGKNLLLLISRGDPEPSPMYGKFYKHLDEWLNIIPFALGAAQFEFLHQYGAHLERKSAANDAEVLQKARLAGAKLVGK